MIQLKILKVLTRDKEKECHQRHLADWPQAGLSFQ